MTNNTPEFPDYIISLFRLVLQRTFRVICSDSPLEKGGQRGVVSFQDQIQPPAPPFLSGIFGPYQSCAAFFKKVRCGISLLSGIMEEAESAGVFKIPESFTTSITVLVFFQKEKENSRRGYKDRSEIKEILKTVCLCQVPSGEQSCCR